MGNSTKKTFTETALLGTVKLAVIAFGLWAALQGWNYTTQALSSISHTLEAVDAGR